MLGCCSTIIHPPLIRRPGRRLNNNRRHSPIHILNDDVLLNIFHLYRLAEPDEFEDEKGSLNYRWDRQRSSWWYKLAHVCRLWRNLILESPSRLNLHLLCANGVPVADVLAHSPPLPLTIRYRAFPEITAEDESGIFLALSHRDRVHYVDLWMPNVGKFVTAMDDQFPILERMYIHSGTKVDLPLTFQAPNLRNLILSTASLSIVSPLLTTSTVGLVTLELLNILPSAYFPPSYILTRLALMATLERLSITFHSLITNHDVERQLHQTPDTITLPNLRQFLFQGTATYLEGLVAWISVPSLSVLRVNLFNQLPFTVPRLCQLMQSSENLIFRAVQVTFGALAVSLHAVPWKSDTPLMLQIRCGHWYLDSRVVSAIPFFGTLSPALSFVEQVTFSYDERYQQLEWLNNVDRSQWHELLRPFTNVKTIHVKDGLISKIFRSLQSDDGEPPLELLPNLEEIGYSGGSDARDAFTRFLNERQVLGYPVSLRVWAVLDANRWIEVRLSTQLSILNRAHTVTPAYYLVYDDHQILVIDEIAKKRPN
ncbi:hypothetical protein BGW80DRAFT_1454947 [Lactifluus volemus]|nr:hypothetical protein BGW80DRAFT_1454947 [Lactifluus volemus]